MSHKKSPEGKRLKISMEIENWGSFTLENGAKVRYKTVLLEAVKLKGKGNGYYFRSSMIVDVKEPKP